MNHPVEILVVALIAFWSFVLFTGHFAVRYFNRDAALLQALVGQQPPGKSGVSDLLVLVPLFALMVGVLQAALFVGAITLVLPINRLISAAELVAAAGWIGYLASRPRATPPTTGTTPNRDASHPTGGQGTQLAIKTPPAAVSPSWRPTQETRGLPVKRRILGVAEMTQDRRRRAFGPMSQLVVRKWVGTGAIVVGLYNMLSKHEYQPGDIRDLPEFWVISGGAVALLGLAILLSPLRRHVRAGDEHPQQRPRRELDRTARFLVGAGFILVGLYQIGGSWGVLGGLVVVVGLGTLLSPFWKYLKARREN